MESIGLSQVGSALLITLGFLVVSIVLVGLAMWGTYLFFKNKNESNEPNNSEKDEA